MAVFHGLGAVMPTKPAAPVADVHLGRLPDAELVVFLPWSKPFDGAGWLFEPRYDGFRGLLYRSASGCEIRARQDFHFEEFRDLRDRVASVLGDHEAILDGEIVSLDAKGKPVFRDLLKGQGYLAFAAFDLLWLDGCDLRALPLGERKQRLAALLPLDTGPLYKVFTLEEHGRALFETARKMDLEGIVAKRSRDPYAPETFWYEIRNPAYRQGESGMDRSLPRSRPRAPDRETVE